MTSRFMTDPHAMRDMAGRFEVHAQTVEDEARRMWASAQNISGAGWSGMAEATSLDTMTQMNQAFRNIVNMLHGVRDGLVRDANNYEQQEQASQQILPSLTSAGLFVSFRHSLRSFRSLDSQVRSAHSTHRGTFPCFLGGSCAILRSSSRSAVPM